MKRRRPTVIYLNPNEDKKNSVIRYIGRRVLQENKNFLCALTGGTGEGKSWGAISIAEIYSKMFNIEFNPDIHIIHSLKQLLELLTEKDFDKKIKIGSVIVFEEIQVEGNARSWHTEANRALNRVVSTFRDKRLIVLFTTPVLKHIDNQSRMLFHGEFEVQGFNKQTKITTIRPRFLTPKHKTVSGDEFYRKCLLVKYKVEGRERLMRYKISNWEIPKASQDILERYEKKKEDFNRKLNLNTLKSIKLREEKEKGMNKAEEFMYIRDLFDKYGEDYMKISPRVPHIPLTTLEKMILMIKRTLKNQQRADVVA
jgi:hypothetical protein